VAGDKLVVSDANSGHHPGWRHRVQWSGLHFIYRKASPPREPGGGETTNPTQTTPTEPERKEPPPSTERQVLHYSCGFATPTLNHTVEPGQHWGTEFVTQGLTITGGAFYVAAQDDLPEHREHLATVGVYTDASLTTSLGSVIVAVPIGGTGIVFKFSEPIPVLYNQSLYFAITAHDRFTAYDIDQSASVPSEPDGCFIGRLEGTSPPVYAEQVVPELSARTFLDYHSASGEGPTIGAEQVVQVFCKVYDPTIPSVLPGGYWYRIASAPWRGRYYSPANSFLNGDPPGGPYTHSTDLSVPNCS
jgi:hypothetical protein